MAPCGPCVAPYVPLGGPLWPLCAPMDGMGWDPLAHRMPLHRQASPPWGLRHISMPATMPGLVAPCGLCAPVPEHWHGDICAAPLPPLVRCALCSSSGHNPHLTWLPRAASPPSSFWNPRVSYATASRGLHQGGHMHAPGPQPHMGLHMDQLPCGDTVSALCVPPKHHSQHCPCMR